MYKYTLNPEWVNSASRMGKDCAEKKKKKKVREHKKIVVSLSLLLGCDLNSVSATETCTRPDKSHTSHVFVSRIHRSPIFCRSWNSLQKQRVMMVNLEMLFKR